MRSFAVFLLLFVALYALGYSFLGTTWGDRAVAEPWIEADIRVARFFAAAAGLDARIEQERTLVAGGGGAGVQVNRGCDGLGALLLVVSAILGFPAPWRARAAGVLLGAACVLVINAFRIATLLWIAVNWPDRLQFFHIDVWQPLMVVISFGLFLGWGVLLAGRPREKPAGAERNPVAAAGLRILAAIALYLVLVAVWLRAGLDAVYDGFVLATAKRLLPALTHYPVGSSEGVELLDVHNQAFVLVWIVALALVVTGVPPKKRIVGYTTLVAAVFVLHVAGLALQLHLALAFKSQESLGVPLLLPWEVQGLKIAAQLLFLAGLQVAAFVAVVLTAFWSTGRGPAGWFGTAERAASPAADRSPAVPRRSLAFVALAGTTLVAATAIAAWWIRERDPRHLAAHTRVGDAFARQQMLPEAERQYRAALRGGADTGQTWMALAVVVHHQGDNAETARVLERALEAVTDPEWRPRLERARDQVSD